MNARSIDLNCDLGERADSAAISEELQLLGLVSSVNVACGGHAGDRESMTRTVVEAMTRGVAIGAHPSYPDRVNFGRVECLMSRGAIEDTVAVQVDALLRIIDREGAELRHVKPHGALYHAAMRREEVAVAVAEGVARVAAPVMLVGLGGSPALAVWRDMGFVVLGEAFADRRYLAGGSLMPRTGPDAMISDPDEAAVQAVNLVLHSVVTAADGSVLKVTADTLCVHSDTPNAVAIARAVRTRLAHARVEVQAPRRA